MIFVLICCGILYSSYKGYERTGSFGDAALMVVALVLMGSIVL